MRGGIGGRLRSRPPTAGGITFLNLEDETGMLNVTCGPGLWQRYRRTALDAAALVVRGVLERVEGPTRQGRPRASAVNLRADRLTALAVPVRPASRDFR